MIHYQYTYVIYLLICINSYWYSIDKAQIHILEIEYKVKCINLYNTYLVWISYYTPINIDILI